eukprot:gene7967-13865_t
MAGPMMRNRVARRHEKNNARPTTHNCSSAQNTARLPRIQAQNLGPKLLVHGKKILSPQNFVEITFSAGTVENGDIFKTNAVSPEYLRIQRELKIVKCPDLRQAEIVKHKINIGDATPIRQPPYIVPLAKQGLIDKEVEKLLVKEIIRPSYNSINFQNAPGCLQLFSKPDGSTCFCIDYIK